VETPRDHALPGYINGVPDLTAFKAGRPDLEDGDDPATGLQDGSHSAGEGGGVDGGHRRGHHIRHRRGQIQRQ
jgi:hypothetical protein